MIMKDEIILRKQAVELHLQGVPICDIVHSLGRSRQWVHKWINRYRSVGGDDWYLSISTAPKRPGQRTPRKEEDLVINVRKALAGRRYSQTGALSIMYEIKRMGFHSPSIATINRILKRNDLITSSSVKQKKGIEYPNYFTLVQQMDLVGPRYLTGGSRFYFQNIIDVENHHVGVYPIRDKSSQTLAYTLLTSGLSMECRINEMVNNFPLEGAIAIPRIFGIVCEMSLSRE